MSENSHENSSKNLRKIGFVAKAHGIKGEVLVKTLDKENSYITKDIELFVKAESLEISNLRRSKEGLIIKFKSLDTRNESELLRGADVSVRVEVFEDSLADGEIYLNQLLGFKVLLEGKAMGTVSGFSETAAHDLLRLELLSGGEVEIPYVDNFIIEINKLDKIINVNCPVELFDEDFLNGSKKKS